jgi:hypothetical protein
VKQQGRQHDSLIKSTVTHQFILNEKTNGSHRSLGFVFSEVRLFRDKFPSTHPVKEVLGSSPLTKCIADPPQQ